MVIVLKSYEKHSFYRFFFIFILVTTLLFFALASLYYYKERNRYFQEKKLEYKIAFNECKHLKKILHDSKECIMQEVDISDKLSLIYKEIAIAFLLALLFIIPIAYYVAKLSLLPIRLSVETMDNFINGIVHDINTPLSVIRINAQSMEKKLENTLLRSKNSRIIQATEHIEALEEQLLFMLKIHQFVPKKEKFRLDELLLKREGYYKDIRQSISIKMQIEPLIVYADKYALSRMIDNIVINAIKYSNPKESVRLYLKNSLLSVEDRGCGIKHPKEVFHKYYRESQKTKGLGLGLYVVKEIADAHDIKIEIDSKLQEGTTFRVDLRGVTA